jgi:DNA polymerase-3 subunit gamma/tau
MAKEEHVSFEPEALHIIAQKADGGLRDACSIFDQMVAFTGNHLTYKQVVENLNVLDYDYYFKITDAFLVQGLPEIMLTFDDILKKGFDGHNFLIGLGEHLRNLLVSKDPQTVSLLEVSDALKIRYTEQSQKCSLTFLLKALALISKTDVNYKSAKNQRLLVEMTLMQLTFLTASPDAEKKNDELEVSFEKKSETESTTTISQTRVTSLQESEIKLATKPSVPFDQLKIKSAFSLNETRITQSNKPVETTVISNEEVIPKEANKDVTIEDVKTVIANYATIKQESGARQLAVTLSTAQITLTNKTITLQINNESQKEKLMAIKQEFLDELRKLLHNNLITLELETTVAEAQGKAYKPVDIFKSMAEKNPALLELKKRFDLEIDY